MSEYRIFAIGPDGRFAGEPKIVECIDDQEAIHKALQFIDGRDLEVWTSYTPGSEPLQSLPLRSGVECRRFLF